MQFDGALNTAGSLVSGVTFTYTGSNLFDPNEVNTFALYWGSPLSTSTFQSMGTAVSGSVSAVPEPGAYACLAGITCLVFAFARRRRYRSVT